LSGKTPEKPDVPVSRKGEDVHINIGDRTWRVRGLAKNQNFDVMKINLRVMAGSLYHVDNLDLYCARHRTGFINTAAAELQLKAEIIKRDIGKVLLKQEQLGLQVADEKTHMADLKPKNPGDGNRRRRIDFLGFTIYRTRTRNKTSYKVVYRTQSKGFARSKKAMRWRLRQMMHDGLWMHRPRICEPY
jgi:hypothetical protein